MISAWPYGMGRQRAPDGSSTSAASERPSPAMGPRRGIAASSYTGAGRDGHLGRPLADATAGIWPRAAKLHGALDLHWVDLLGRGGTRWPRVGFRRRRRDMAEPRAKREKSKGWEPTGLSDRPQVASVGRLERDDYFRMDETGGDSAEITRNAIMGTVDHQQRKVGRGQRKQLQRGRIVFRGCLVACDVICLGSESAAPRALRQIQHVSSTRSGPPLQPPSEGRGGEAPLTRHPGAAPPAAPPPAQGGGRARQANATGRQLAKDAQARKTPSRQRQHALPKSRLPARGVRRGGFDTTLTSVLNSISSPHTPVSPGLLSPGPLLTLHDVLEPFFFFSLHLSFRVRGCIPHCVLYHGFPSDTHDAALYM